MRYILRNLAARRVRTGLSMLGVSVSVAAVVALISVATGLRSSIDTHMAASGADLTVFSRDAADLLYSRVRNDDIARIEKLPGVREVNRANFTAVMAPRVGEGHGSIGILFCFGRLPHERIMKQYERSLVAGHMPAAPSEILAGSFVAEQMRLKVDDTLPIFRAPVAGVEEFTVVGIYNSEINWENNGVVLDARLIQAQLGQTDGFNILFLFTGKDAARAVADRIEKEFPHLVAVPAGEFTDRFAAQMAIIDDFIVVVTGVALLVGVLGVLNTLMMSVSERTREIGTLRAVGWSRGMVVKVIVAEGVLLSLVGGLIGLGMGVLGTEALIAFFTSAPLQAVYRPETFLKGMAVGLGVGLIAALYPAWRAANLRPVEALRYE